MQYRSELVLIWKHVTNVTIKVGNPSQVEK